MQVWCYGKDSSAQVSKGSPRCFGSLVYITWVGPGVDSHFWQTTSKQQASRQATKSRRAQGGPDFSMSSSKIQIEPKNGWWVTLGKTIGTQFGPQLVANPLLKMAQKWSSGCGKDQKMTILSTFFLFLRFWPGPPMKDGLWGERRAFSGF